MNIMNTDATITSCSSSPPSAKRQRLIAPAVEVAVAWPSSLVHGGELQQRDTTAANEAIVIHQEDATSRITTPITASGSTTTAATTTTKKKKKMTMGNNESIECTTSTFVPEPQVIPAGTSLRRGKRELASLGVTRRLEQPSEPQRRQTRSSSRSGAETPLLPARTGSKKTKAAKSKSYSRPVAAAAAGRNKSSCRESTAQKTARSKLRSASSEAVASVVSNKVPASLPLFGRGYRRKSARVLSSSAVPVVTSTTRKRKPGRIEVSEDVEEIGAPRQRLSNDSTTCDDLSGMNLLRDAVLLALLAENRTSGGLNLVQATDVTFALVPRALSLFADNAVIATEASETVVQSKATGKSPTVPLVRVPLIESSESKTRELSVADHPIDETKGQPQADEHHQAVPIESVDPSLGNCLIKSSASNTKELSVSHHPIDEATAHHPIDEATEQPTAEEHCQAARIEAVDPSVRNSLIESSESKTKELSVADHPIDETTEQSQAEEYCQAVRTESVDPSVRDSLIESSESKTRDFSVATEQPQADELSVSDHCPDEAMEQPQAEEHHHTVRTDSVDPSVRDSLIESSVSKTKKLSVSHHPIDGTTEQRLAEEHYQAVRTESVELSVGDSLIESKKRELSVSHRYPIGETTEKYEVAVHHQAVQAESVKLSVGNSMTESKTKELSVSYNPIDETMELPQAEEYCQAVRTKSVEAHQRGNTKIQLNRETDIAAEHSLLSVSEESTGVLVVAVPLCASYSTELSGALAYPNGRMRGTIMESRATVKSPATTRVGHTLIESGDLKTNEFSVSHNANTAAEKPQGETNRMTRLKSVNVPPTGLAPIKTNEDKETITKHPERCSDALVAVVPPDIPHHSIGPSCSQPPPTVRSSIAVVPPKGASKSLEIDDLHSSHCASRSVYKFKKEASKSTSSESTEASATGLTKMKASGEKEKLSKHPETSTDTLVVAVPLNVSHQLSGLKTPLMDLPSERRVQSKPDVKSPTILPDDDSLFELSESKTDECLGLQSTTSERKLKKESSKPPCLKSNAISVSSLTKMETRGDKKRLLVDSSVIAPPEIFDHSTESSCLQSPPTDRSSDLKAQPKVAGKSTVPSVNDTSIDSSEDNTKEPPGTDGASALGGTPQAKRATIEEPSDDIDRSTTSVESPKVGTLQARLVKRFETSCAFVAQTEVPPDDLDRASTSVRTPQDEKSQGKVDKPFSIPCTNLAQSEDFPVDADRASTLVRTPQDGTSPRRFDKPFSILCSSSAQSEDCPDDSDRLTTSVGGPHAGTPAAKSVGRPQAKLVKPFETPHANSDQRGDCPEDADRTTTSAETSKIGTPQARLDKPFESPCANSAQSGDCPGDADRPTTSVGAPQAKSDKHSETPCANSDQRGDRPEDADRTTRSAEGSRIGTRHAKLVKPFKTPCANLAQSEDCPDDADRPTTSVGAPQAKLDKHVETPCANSDQVGDCPHDADRATTSAETSKVGKPQARLDKPFESPCVNSALNKDCPDDADPTTTSMQTPKAKLVKLLVSPLVNATMSEDPHHTTTSTKTPKTKRAKPFKARTSKSKRAKPSVTKLLDVTMTEEPLEPHHKNTSTETPIAKGAKPSVVASHLDVIMTEEPLGPHHTTASMKAPKARTSKAKRAKPSKPKRPKAKRTKPSVAPLLDVTMTEGPADTHCDTKAMDPLDVGTSQAGRVKPSEASCADITKKSRNDENEVSIETPLPTKLIESDYRFQPIRAKESPIRDTRANVVQESRGPTAAAFGGSTTKSGVVDTTSAALVASVTPDPVVVGDFPLANRVAVISDQDMADFVQDTLCSGVAIATQLPELWDAPERGFLERFYVADLDTMTWEGANILEDLTIS